jgi:hypothetical protein
MSRVGRWLLAVVASAIVLVFGITGGCLAGNVAAWGLNAAKGTMTGAESRHLEAVLIGIGSFLGLAASIVFVVSEARKARTGRR